MAYHNKKAAGTRIIITRSLKSRTPLSPTFLSVIWFQAFKAISGMARDYCPADYEFYENKRYFFYETKVNPVKTSTAKLMIRLMLRGMNKRFYINQSPNFQ